MANELKEWLSGFKNSYIGVMLASTKATRPVHISEVQPLVGKNIVTGKIITNGLKTKEWSSPFDELLKTFIWVPPTQSMLNLDGVACWLGFSARRNTLKGWSTRHLNVRFLNGDIPGREQVSVGFDDDLEIPYQVFSGDGFKFPSFQDALKSLDEGHRLSCAIAAKLAIGNKKGVKQPLVYFEDKIIGIVESTDKVKLEAPFMRYKELFYKRWNVNCAELPEVKQEGVYIDAADAPRPPPPLPGAPRLQRDALQNAYWTVANTGFAADQIHIGRPPILNFLDFPGREREVEEENRRNQARALERNQTAALAIAELAEQEEETDFVNNLINPRNIR